MRERLLAGLALSIVLIGVDARSSMGYDQYIYDNLQRSRDALLGQRAELERNRADIARQVDLLNAKLNRYDVYLREVDNSIKDVNDALNGIR